MTEMTDSAELHPGYRPLDPLPSQWTNLGRAFWHSAKTYGSKPLFSDSNGTTLSYGETLLRSMALARALSRRLAPRDQEPHVGLWMPPTVPAAVANLALILLGRVPVNLNYSASQEAIDTATQRGHIRHVLTSHKVLERFSVRPQGELILLEELRDQISLPDKVMAWICAKILPRSLVVSQFPGLADRDPDELAILIFTSGSTGQPKGVMLTHRNILSNCWAFSHQIDLSPDEVVLGILPLFHSMGMTVTLWAIACLGLTVVYHPNPLDGRTVGRLVEKHQATLLLATPTFLKSYQRRCTADQFASLTRIVIGAEKLKDEQRAELEATYNAAILEGYGCTETSPVLAVNSNGSITLPSGATISANRPGSVGQPLPGTQVKVVDPETRQTRPTGSDQAGLILVKGPQVMKGYLEDSERTAKVLQDGWYETGDLGHLDPDGFLWVTDRLSRFSKIGGEMVPHVKVESCLLQLLEEAPTHGFELDHNQAGAKPSVEADRDSDVGSANVVDLAVTGIPDLKRGERLVVLYARHLDRSPEELSTDLRQSGQLPALWIPDPADFHRVEQIPLLGSGKVNLQEVKTLAHRLTDSERRS